MKYYYVAFVYMLHGKWQYASNAFEVRVFDPVSIKKKLEKMPYDFYQVTILGWQEIPKSVAVKMKKSTQESY